MVYTFSRKLRFYYNNRVSYVSLREARKKKYMQEMAHVPYIYTRRKNKGENRNITNHNIANRNIENCNIATNCNIANFNMENRIVLKKMLRKGKEIELL